MPYPRQPSCLAASAFALVVPHWVVTHVNQERDVVPRHGSIALCQAIPAVGIGPVLRWRGGDARRLTVRITSPEQTRAVRRVTPRGRQGRRTVVFAPSAFGHDAFREGTYRLQVRRGGRVLTRGSLRFAGDGRC